MTLARSLAIFKLFCHLRWPARLLFLRAGQMARSWQKAGGRLDVLLFFKSEALNFRATRASFLKAPGSKGGI